MNYSATGLKKRSHIVTTIVENNIIVDSKGIHKKLDKILKGIELLKKGITHMSLELDDLEIAVKENTDLDDSIVTLVNGLATQVAALKNDPVKLQALAVSLRAKSAAIAAAILANTEAAPTEGAV